MLSVDEAIDLIHGVARPLEPEVVALEQGLGRTLAEPVVSDVDSPPFDKSLMDGYAVRSNDLQLGGAVLDVAGEVTAGAAFPGSLASGTALRIMTGAPIPGGADAVVRFEDAVEDAGRVRIARPVVPGTSILKRGASMRRGEVVLSAGRPLRAQEVGALAELGRSRVPVIGRPRIAVLATGDELVPIDREPGAGQIRNSNEAMLCAQALQLGCQAVPLGIARDDPRVLEERIRAGLLCDVLCLSGGVSMGTRDLVPAVLARCGVRQVFHRVNLKPGKPIWFGVTDDEEEGRRYIFGLPGNPVSSMVCFELFVRTLLMLLMGREPARPTPVSARLRVAYTQRDERSTYVPSRFEIADDGPRVTLVAWKGSADLRATVDANAMTLFPPGAREYAAGEVVPVFLW